MNGTSIKTAGTARISQAGEDILAFHLHRYLAHWLAKTELAHVWVTVGWEHSSMPCTTIDVGRHTSSSAEVTWTFAELDAKHHDLGADFTIEADGLRLDVEPIRDEASDGTPVVIGFVLMEAGLSAPAKAELEVHTSEAIQAARRNSVRLFFDECDERDMKALLYALLDRLPEWVGGDVAAAMVLANSLEAMALDHATNAKFYVMAERLFSEESEQTRLVGLSIDTRDDTRTVVDATIEWLAMDPKHHSVQFVRRGEGYVDPAGEPAVSIAQLDGRPDDGRSVLVPLIADRGESELLGFLCVAVSGHQHIPVSVLELLDQLGKELGHVLRTSPLYTLSAGRLRLLRSIRGVCETSITMDSPAEARRDELVRQVVDLVKASTSVPAFSVGYIVDDPRQLRYTASYGWSDFEAIDLPVDVTAQEHADSGVSALAVRLARPIVLAGGRRAGDHQEFKNFLWVNESDGRIVDARALGPSVVDEAGWTRLGEYYKPARTSAYATVAHPITFDGVVLGVVALEVDRETDWTWWAGYGGELLWELVGSELAFALWGLNRELNG